MSFTTRRGFLRLLAASATAAAAAPALVACSGGSDDAAGSGSGSGSGDGGRDVLRIAAIGAPGETFNPGKAASVATWTGIYAIFESLVVTGPEGPVMMLAKSAESNDDATEWTVALRDDAKFSDGSPVTGDDVLKSFASSKELPMKGMELADIDIDGSTADETSVVFRLTRPRADFVPSVLGMSSLVFKGGDLDAGLGSGPYVAAEGDSSQGWTLPANEHFPADRRVSTTLEIQAMADPDARIRAVESGAVDLALDLPSTAVRTLEGTDAEAWVPGEWDSKGLAFVLNTRVAPFDDPEVRRAAKIALDRQAMVDQVLDGEGTPGVDVLGHGFPGFPSDITPAKRDVEEAKKIFKDKGVTELTLVTAEFSPGMNGGADLAARQLEEAGVKVTVDKRDPSTYFADMAALQKLPFFAMFLLNRPLVTGLPFTTGTGGMMNNSGFGADAKWDAKLAEAAAETDATKREEMLGDLARVVHEDGGDLIWAFANEIHGRTQGVPDILISQQVPVPYKA
ncbi:ABC transporter substrate-binding protein [Corynebacterium sp. 335C]